MSAKRESVALHGLRTPISLNADTDGQLRSVEFVRGWRQNGRRKAIAINDSEFEVECDTLLVAIGQKTVSDFLDTELNLDRWNNAAIDETGFDWRAITHSCRMHDELPPSAFVPNK